MVSSGLSRVSVTGGTFHSGYFSSVIRVSPLLPECQVTFINLDIKFLQHLVRYFLPQFCPWSFGAIFQENSVWLVDEVAGMSFPSQTNFLSAMSKAGKYGNATLHAQQDAFRVLL